MNPKTPKLSIDMKSPSDPTRESLLELQDKQQGINYNPLQTDMAIRSPVTGQLGYGPNAKKT